jgi:hypothetical protein
MTFELGKVPLLRACSVPNDLLSPVDCFHGRGESEAYVHPPPDAPDVDVDKARWISLDLANVEASHDGIEKFVKKWGMPTGNWFMTEREFYEKREQVRITLLSAMTKQRFVRLGHHYPKNRSNLLEMMYRTYKGGSFDPDTPFECAMRELHILSERGVFSQIRECQECKLYFIANKRTADRKGSGPASPQKYCLACGSRARPKARRQRLKLADAEPPTRKMVSADPRDARPGDAPRTAAVMAHHRMRGGWK